MRINHQVVVFDAADLAAESSFWAGVLDGTVDAEDDFHMPFVDGAPRVGIVGAGLSRRGCRVGLSGRGGLSSRVVASGL
jgi:hypothetical protein